MQNKLYITNGDSAVNGLKSAGYPGPFLPIRDALHVGPLFFDDDMLSDQSARCDFIIEQRWASAGKVYSFQQERRQLLADIHSYDCIQLWFEHDLYDQFQLIWVLHFLHLNKICPTKIELVITDLYLGCASDNDMHELLRFQEACTSHHLELATMYWSILTASNPNEWTQLMSQNDCLFPFVGPAVERFCREFPSIEMGISLTAERILKAINDQTSAGDIFRIVQHQEQAAFMGDLQFFQIMDEMIDNPAPLLTKSSRDSCISIQKQLIGITELGSQVSEQTAHYADFFKPNCWFGGVHLSADNYWCYNKVSKCFIKRSS